MWLRAVAFLSLFSVSLLGQDLKINMGPVAGSVIQRDAEGRAEIKLAGTAPRTTANKFVEARVVNDKGEPLNGLDWKALEREMDYICDDCKSAMVSVAGVETSEYHYLSFAERKERDLNFQPPLDVVDGAARVLDPIFSGLSTGEHASGKFFKDYRPSEW